jgi:hypothetical protein
LELKEKVQLQSLRANEGDGSAAATAEAAIFKRKVTFRLNAVTFLSTILI